MGAPRPVGDLLREWRQRRRLTQLELAGDAEISTRHLSILESGRAQPSREMVLRLASTLDVPLRDRNTLLIAAGYAPTFPHTPLSDPELDVVRTAIDVVLAGHEPYPAIAIDSRWTLIASNAAVTRLLAAIDPALLRPPVNILRCTLHPGGLAPRIANYADWRRHVLEKLRRQIDARHDRAIVDLLNELRSYPAPAGACTAAVRDRERPMFAIPFQLVTDAGVLSFFSTTTVFGTPLNVTVAEVSLECFYPADRPTEEALRRAAIPAHPSQA
jgi:transcriptional regulator with XRE-family HTH domain